MSEDPIRLSEIDFFRDRGSGQVKVEFEMAGGAEPELLTEVVDCSPSPLTEEYSEIVRKAATAIHKRLVKSAAFLAQKYNL